MNFYEQIKYFASHGAIYVIASVVAVFILWSAFVKPSQTITARKGSNVYVTNADKETPILGCSLYKVKAKLVWQ